MRKSISPRLLAIPLPIHTYGYSTDSHTQGHGTLHSIYASVKESCRIKGWDGVDVLIIGGDFQVGTSCRIPVIARSQCRIGSSKQVRSECDRNASKIPQDGRFS
jgi:hypothetical protein